MIQRPLEGASELQDISYLYPQYYCIKVYSQSSSSSVFDEPGSVSAGGGIMAETLSIAPLTDDSGFFAPDIPYKYSHPSELYHRAVLT